MTEHAATPSPVAGLRFTHARRGVECYVVRVTRTGVYYRLAGGHGGGNINRKNWPTIYAPTAVTSPGGPDA